MQFKVSDFGVRDVINLVDGAKLGPVKDMYIDLESGQIVSLVLSGERKFFGMLSAGGDVVVPWERIKKIGVHTVLVEV